MTEIIVQTTEANVSVVDPASAVVNVTAGQDSIFIDPPDMAYASLYDTTSQTASSSTTTYKVGINTTDVAYLISNDAGTITFDRSGTYSITFSVQFLNSSQSIVDTNIFAKKNNQPLSWSNSITSVPNRHGQINGAIITTVNFVLQFTAGDTFQLWWQANSSEATLHSSAAQTSPEIPGTPGVILTIVQVD